MPRKIYAVYSYNSVFAFQVHKAVDLSAFPDREVMWYLEVLEAYKLFYQPIMGEWLNSSYELDQIRM